MVEGLGLKDGARVWGLEQRTRSSGFRVQGLRCRV
jgi:hypothetical protein